MASKVVVLGALCGSFSVFGKLAKLHAKQSFTFGIICGDLYANPGSSGDVNEGDDPEETATNQEQQVKIKTGNDDVEKLISGQIAVPFPMYFTVGKHALPPRVIEMLSQNDHELCNNLYYLGKNSVFKTSEGVRIVALGGNLVTSIPPSNNVDDKFLPYHTEQHVKGLNGAHSADILLTSSWPSGIRVGSRVDLPDGTQEPSGEQCIADLASRLKPRYHFCASPALFYEREPFLNPSSDPQANNSVTRFISLASPGTATKQKHMYAFNLDPSTTTTISLPQGVTPSPFRSPTSTKRSLPSDFDHHRFSAPTRDSHNGQFNNKRRRRERAPPHQSQCFFCLSNTPSTHLITAIGEDAYLTTSRGPVSTPSTFAPHFSCPAQILIIPFAHAPTIASIPSSAGDNLERKNTYEEMLRLRGALNEMLKAKGEGKLGSVCWEINKQAGVHVHWQWMPVPVEMVEKGLVEAGLKVQAEADGYGAFEKREVGDGSEVDGDWFRIWVWEPVENEATCWFLPLDPSQKFDLQFGRRVMAKLLGTPERAHWKDVVQADDEEKRDVDAFKVAFKQWDFTETS